MAQRSDTKKTATFSFDAWVKKQAQESGVPEYVEDAAVLGKAARLAASIVKAG